MVTISEYDSPQIFTNGLRPREFLLKKTEGQTAIERLREINNLHEPAPANRVGAPTEWFDAEDATICAECWTAWPCTTNRIASGKT